MAEAQAVGRAGPAASVLKGLRFLATDRIGVMLLVWAVAAFWLRPLLLAAHHGDPGAMLEGIRARFGSEGLQRVTAVTQWASFAGAIVIAAMAHVRYAAWSGRSAATLTNFAIAAGYLVLMVGGYVLFLWTPASVFTLIAHDSFIFIDSTLRIDQGQMPSRDFPTAIGAVAFYLPWLGAKIAGGYAGSVEMASAILALLLGLAVAQAGASRFPAGVTAMLVALVFLVTVPAALLEHWGGESITVVDGRMEILIDDLTWAMFYNRWGWAALIPVFAFLAPRKDQAAPKIAEMVAFAALLAFLFYLKLSYFLVGAAAAAAWAFMNPKPIRTLAIGGGAALGITLILGLFTGYLFPYLRDVAFTAKVSGSRTDFLLPIIRQNLQTFLLAGAPLAVLAAAGKATWKDVLATALIVLGSLFVINQNGQLTNIVSLVVIGAYGVARVWSIEGAGRMARIAAMGVFLLLSAGTLLDRGMLLIDQAYAARREEGRPPAAWSSIPAMKGIYIAERESFFEVAAQAVSPDERRTLVRTEGEMRRRQELRQGEYMQTILSGIADLKTVVKPGESVMTLDMVNPFPAMMGVREAKGSWLTLHAGRTISKVHHPAPEVFFADADHVMIAKDSMVQPTAKLMLEVYGPWLKAHYEQTAESDHWWRFSHRRMPVELRH